MVQFVNKLTGGVMWVDESRTEEYKAAGHKLAAVSVKSDKPETETPKQVQRKRSPAKKK